MSRVILLAGFLLTGVLALDAQSVPNPIVTGPIPATVVPGDASHNYPFFSTNTDLASRGYVEEEFFFEGTANRYNIASPLATASVIPGSSQPYRTRMIVRRPISQENFNGTVIMEWQANLGYDLDATWLAVNEHLMRRGYAWIGVSAQRAGVHTASTGLTEWNPNRYGALNVPSDDFSWDIFSQAAQAVRRPQGVDPMGGLRVERMFAAGVSQGANRLATYHNAIHPLVGVFDAFALGEGGALLRTDQPFKVFKVLSETDVAGNQVAKSQAFIRQDESDHFRRWEIAGAAHMGFDVVQAAAPLQVRDGLPVVANLTCDQPPFSRIPMHFVIAAVFDSVAEWVKRGVEPPHGADIAVVSLGEQISILARDSFGNALGGIRLSQHAVPTATNTGLNYPALTGCRTFGSYVPFDPATLDALYPDHQTYLELVIAATHENQNQGFIDGADAAATIREAAESEIGRR